MEFLNVLTHKALLIPEIYSSVLSDSNFAKKFRLFLIHLKRPAQLTILQLILVDLPIRHPSIRACDYPAEQAKCGQTVSGVSAFFISIIGDRPELKEQIAEWLIKGQFAATLPTAVYRGILTIFDVGKMSFQMTR